MLISGVLIYVGKLMYGTDAILLAAFGWLFVAGFKVSFGSVMNLVKK